MTKSIELATKIKDIREHYRGLARHAFGQFTKQLFEDFPNLERVTLRGYTPGFNDGDPCVHTQQTYVTPTFQLAREFGGWQAFDDFLDDEALPNQKLTAEECRVITEAFDTFEDVINDIYGTDFELTWRRKLDGIAFEHTDYDCGF